MAGRILLGAAMVAAAGVAYAQGGGGRTWDFQADAVNSPPAGFGFGRTGQGREGRWIVLADPTAPSGGHVLAQTDTDGTDDRFPVAFANEPQVKDLRLEVRCKAVGGKVDEACGLVFRFKDPDNYYVARANALEDNVNLYHVVKGRRREIKGWRGKVTADAWHTLAVEARGDRLQVFWEGKPIIDARDDTFRDAGKIGLWTKADSVTYFAALTLNPSPRAEAPQPAAPAPAPAAPPALAITPSKDFPKGTATPSAECGACHQAIYREYAGGFGSDMRYPGVKLRASGDQTLELPAGTSVAASAHAVAGTDPWPVHAREAEEENKKCNVCHFPQPFAIPERTALEVAKPAPRAETQEAGITCASCHLTPEGKIRGPHQVAAPHETVADERLASAEMCAFCHSLGKRVPGKQTQTYLEWRDDFATPGLGRQQCQDCHMPRTQRKTAEDSDVPVRAVARHLWTGGHSGQRLGSALSLVMLQPQRDRPAVELHVINVGAGHSVPTGSNRRAIYLQGRVVDREGKVLATREWMFAPWYGPRPDDRAFLKEDEKRPDRIAATQADEQGPHEAPIRAGEERVLTWQPELRDGSYTLEASLVYDLNRYNDRSFKGDQREISRFSLTLPVKASR